MTVGIGRTSQTHVAPLSSNEQLNSPEGPNITKTKGRLKSGGDSPASGDDKVTPDSGDSSAQGPGEGTMVSYLKKEVKDLKDENKLLLKTVCRSANDIT